MYSLRQISHILYRAYHPLAFETFLSILISSEHEERMYDIVFDIHLKYYCKLVAIGG